MCVQTRRTESSPSPKKSRRRFVTVAEEESPSLSPKEPSPSEHVVTEGLFRRRRSREEFSTLNRPSQKGTSSLNCLHHGCISVSYV